MKFGEYLKKHQPEAWKEHCVDYQLLKSYIKKILKAAENESSLVSRQPSAVGSTMALSLDYGDLLAPVHDGVEMPEQSVTTLLALDSEERGPLARACAPMRGYELYERMPHSFDSDEVLIQESIFCKTLIKEIEKASGFYADRCVFFAERANQLFELVARLVDAKHIREAEVQLQKTAELVKEKEKSIAKLKVKVGSGTVETAEDKATPSVTTALKKPTPSTRVHLFTPTLRTVVKTTSYSEALSTPEPPKLQSAPRQRDSKEEDYFGVAKDGETVHLQRSDEEEKYAHELVQSDDLKLGVKKTGTERKLAALKLAVPTGDEQSLHTRNSLRLVKPATAEPSTIELTDISAVDLTTGEKQNKLTDAEIVAEKSRLRRLFRQEYHALNVLATFRTLNAKAVSKITKKHDKNSEWKKLRPLSESLIEMGNLGSGEFEKYLMDRYERAYVNILRPEEQDTGTALERLRRLPSAVKLEKNSCLFGFFSGFSLAIAVALVLMVLSEGEKFWNCWLTKHAWPMFMSCVLLSLYLWLWSVDLAIFQHKRFNHIFIFEIDPGTVLRSAHILRLASLATLITLLFALGFVSAFQFMSARGKFSVGSKRHYEIGIFPVLLFVLSTGFVLFPTKTYSNTKDFLLKSFSKQLRSPFAKVRFIDFFLADQWTSAFTVVVDLTISCCYFLTLGVFKNQKDPVCDSSGFKLWIHLFRILPYHVRLWQCLRRFFETATVPDHFNTISQMIVNFKDVKWKWNHLRNAGKYSCAIITAVISAVHSYYANQKKTQGILLYFRLTMAIITTMYAYTWDLKMDWGLFEAQSFDERAHYLGEVKTVPFLLRKKMRFQPAVYYCAMVVNLFLRVSWAVALFPQAFGIPVPMVYFSLTLGMLEILRRCIWNVFRIENEHMNNCGEFRIIKDVPDLLHINPDIAIQLIADERDDSYDEAVLMEVAKEPEDSGSEPLFETSLPSPLLKPLVKSAVVSTGNESPTSLTTTAFAVLSPGRRPPHVRDISDFPYLRGEFSSVGKPKSIQKTTSMADSNPLGTD